MRIRTPSPNPDWLDRENNNFDSADDSGSTARPQRAKGVILTNELSSVNVD
jgi:hypothetical protein